MDINVLVKGDTFLYTVLFDGFARKCIMLDKPLPAVAKIEFSYENAFIIEVFVISCVFI